MSNEGNSASAHASFGWFGFLGVVLVVLKLNPGGYLDSPVQDWSWWLVTLPFWIGLAILLFFLVVAGVVLGGGAVLDSVSRKRRVRANRERLLNRRR